MNSTLCFVTAPQGGYQIEEKGEAWRTWLATNYVEALCIYMMQEELPTVRADRHTKVGSRRAPPVSPLKR